MATTDTIGGGESRPRCSEAGCNEPAGAHSARCLKHSFCCATVFSDRFRSKCSRRAKVERNGRFYCGQHDPEAVAAKRKKANTRWRLVHAINECDRRFKDLAEQRKRALLAFAEMALITGCFSEEFSNGLTAMRSTVAALDAERDEWFTKRGERCAALEAFDKGGTDGQ